MCQAKPYPRCSKHAWEDYQKALATNDPEKINEAKSAYLMTPAGIAHLRDTGNERLAKRYENLRKHRIIACNTYDNVVSRSHQIYGYSLKDRVPDYAPDSNEGWSHTTNVTATGKRVEPKISKAAQDKRDARTTLEANRGLPIHVGENNPTTWTVMPQGGGDFTHSSVKNVQNPDPNPVAMNRTGGVPDDTRPKNGFTSSVTSWVELSDKPVSVGYLDAKEFEANNSNLSPFSLEYKAKKAELKSRSIAVVPRKDAIMLRAGTPREYHAIANKYFDAKTGGLDYKRMHKDGFDGISVSSTAVDEDNMKKSGLSVRQQHLVKGGRGVAERTVWFTKDAFDVVKPEGYKAPRKETPTRGDGSKDAITKGPDASRTYREPTVTDRELAEDQNRHRKMYASH